MRAVKTAIEGVVIIETKEFSDSRGTFSETFSEREFAKALAETTASNSSSSFTAGVTPDATSATKTIAPIRFVQDNQSTSRRGVVRGLHFQKPPHAQAKLVRCVAGRILDVAVDMRASSPTFGRWISVELSAENRRQLFIPRGFAHGFKSLEDNTIVAYKVDDYYAPECDAGVLWCDPTLGVDWSGKTSGIDGKTADKTDGNFAGETSFNPSQAIVSEKDAALPTLACAFKF